MCGNHPGAEVSADCGCPLMKLFLLLQFGPGAGSLSAAAAASRAPSRLLDAS